MSGVLQRLLTRAVGNAEPNLRPRLPARFEAGPGAPEAFSETHDEVDAPAHGPAEHDRSGDGATASSRPVTQPAETIVPRPVPTSAPVQPGPDARRSKAPPRFVTAREPAATADQTAAFPDPMRGPSSGLKPATRAPIAERSARPARAGHRAAPPESLLPEDPSSVTRAPIAEDSAPPARAGHRAGAPEPLFPEDPPSMVAAAMTGAGNRSGPLAAPDAGVPQPPATGAEPSHDVHIHIGRIELRTDPAAGAGRPKRKARESRIPSLGDYLKGGGA